MAWLSTHQRWGLSVSCQDHVDPADCPAVLSFLLCKRLNYRQGRFGQAVLGGGSRRHSVRAWARTPQASFFSPLQEQYRLITASVFVKDILEFCEEFLISWWDRCYYMSWGQHITVKRIKLESVVYQSTSWNTHHTRIQERGYCERG